MLGHYVPWGICRDEVRELEQALATAHAEHVDFDLTQLRLQESETTHAQQHKVLHVYDFGHSPGQQAWTEQQEYIALS